MIKKYFALILALVAIVIAIFALVGGNQSGIVGGVTNYDAITLDNGDLTISKGNISVSNTATSTISIGCITTNATSSATKIKLSMYASSTIVTAQGFVVWSYGTCP